MYLSYGARVIMETPSNFRKRIKFRKKPHHKKKERSEKFIIQKEWRAKNKLIKDKSKWRHYRRGAGKYYKRYSQKLHRGWVRDNISHQNWDVLANQRKIKFFCDPWLWD